MKTPAPRRRWLQGLLPLLICLCGLAAPPVQARELRAVGTRFPRIFEPGETAADPAAGLGVELLSRAAARLGHSLRFESYPWLRAQAMVEQGQADILIGPYRTPEREARFLFSAQPFYEDALLFYARREQAQLWRGDYAELTPHSIGQVQGWAYGDVFEQARVQLSHLSTVRDVGTGLQMLRLGRLDLLASNERNTEPVLAQLGLAEQLQPVGPPIGHLRGHFAYPRGARGQALRDTLDQAIAEMRARGELRELARRWKVKIPD